MSDQRVLGFCPRDGTLLGPPSDPKAKGECPLCHFAEYDNPRPCVGFFLIDGGRVLLSKRGIEPEKGKWDIPGGYVDRGETAEAAVVREAMEETNLVVEIADYL